MNILETIKEKPDLYIPFWASTMLVFCVFAFGSFSALSTTALSNYAFLGSAMSLIYGYLIFAPVIIYFISKI